ncbi:MAG: thioredoxin domain-containing protein [Gordonia sp. (in: high G+C Gram-positive bacteria)]|uniref:DsbA family protein n=1 Tax=Gordonia sp. (in: high G+C Gram-positive bacteria) TaxID=84139 RepID=UPI0039E42DD3
MTANKGGPQIPNVRGGYKPNSSSNVLTYVLVSLATLLIAALVIGGVVWSANREKDAKDQATTSVDLNGPVTPGVADLTFGAPEAPVAIDIYEDAMCPACAAFEQTDGAAVADAIRGGKLRVRFRPLNFLNEASASKDYSTRAAGALQCVAGEKNQDLFLKFHTSLFEDQPAEYGKTDHSNDELAKMSAKAGATVETQRCIAKGAQVGAAAASAQESSTLLTDITKRDDPTGSVSTPSITRDGKLLKRTDKWLQDLLGN